MRFAYVALIMVLSMGTASADPLKDFNKALSDINQTLSKVNHPTRQASASPAGPNLAPITPEQQEKIAEALAKRAADERVKAMINEASPNIRAFVERLSCIVDGTGGRSLNVYAAPDVRFDTIFFPMIMTHYHNKGSCLSVVRIHGWSAPARNALKFEVVYLADDSGESAKTSHQVVKQPGGDWLFTN